MTVRFVPIFLATLLTIAATGTLSAQESDPFFETLRQGTVTLNKQMFDVVNSINSVEEADAAEPRIAEIMNDFVIMLDGLAEYLTQGFKGDMNSLNAVQTDTEVQEWGEKVAAGVTKLQQEHPDAAARLAEIISGQTEQVVQAMTSLVLLFGEEAEGK